MVQNRLIYLSKLRNSFSQLWKVSCLLYAPFSWFVEDKGYSHRDKPNLLVGPLNFFPIPVYDWFGHLRLSTLIFFGIHNSRWWATSLNWPRPFLINSKNQDRSLRVLYSFVGYQKKHLDLTNSEKKSLGKSDIPFPRYRRYKV